MGNHACSAWMSLDPVPRETALEFVGGSHRWKTEYERPEFFNYRYESDDRTQANPSRTSTPTATTMRFCLGTWSQEIACFSTA